MEESSNALQEVPRSSFMLQYVSVVLLHVKNVRYISIQSEIFIQIPQEIQFGHFRLCFSTFSGM